MKPRPLTFAEYLEIETMHNRIKEIYVETKDSEVGGLIDAMGESMSELKKEHDTDEEEAESLEYEAHVKIESRMSRYV